MRNLAILETVAQRNTAQRSEVRREAMRSLVRFTQSKKPKKQPANSILKAPPFFPRVCADILSHAREIRRITNLPEPTSFGETAWTT